MSSLGLNEGIAILGTVIGVLGLIFAYIQYKKRPEVAKEILRVQYEENKSIQEKEKMLKTQTAEEKYRAVLRKELGNIRMIGPEFENQSAALRESFVSLRLSHTWRSEERFEKSSLHQEETHLSPEQVMVRAFPRFQLLLVVGDPGSGKTTLLKFLAITCLENEQHTLGFGKEKILPIYFPLRDLKFSQGSPESPLPLHENLGLWAQKRSLDISSQDFFNWLHHGKILVLLDGLDEINDVEKRRHVCRWLENARTGLENDSFVLTTRPTGFRKSDGLELACDHLRADILDFSPQQQERFLIKWFRAVYLNERPKDAAKGDNERKEKEADNKAQAIIDFLNKEENKCVRDLARVPMLLQIMAIIWKDRDYLPDSRSALYDISLNYLLEYRDWRKNLKPVLPAEKARLVLAPTALWMQETLRSDNAVKSDIHEFMQPILQKIEKQPNAGEFCQNLRDRAGLIADYGTDRYIFRHKSFMEFLSALQLVIECREDQERINLLIDAFNDDWWEEPIRFFISKSDDKIFGRFMRCFFQSKVSRNLEANKQTLLQGLVKDAPQKEIAALVDSLNNDNLNNNQGRYVLDCLKTIGTPEAVKAVEEFIETSKEGDANLEHARDIAAELTAAEAPKIEEIAKKDLLSLRPSSFRNPFEDNVEYIKIPDGTYSYSVTKKMETVKNLYFCKYPVTNKRYRRFISFLAGKEKELEKELPPDVFAKKLLEFSSSVKGYTEYLGADITGWPGKLRSRYDDDKRFKGDDQPVVGVTWYGARAYCFWLSCLETSSNSLYRLPLEKEWEWAAGGEEDGSIRGYPWSKEKGEPNTNLANYGQNVGATTPVGRYPEGATPLALMDMAGNVWEWMGNYYDEEKKFFALRGGSWNFDVTVLRCSARVYGDPDDDWGFYGFRVVRGLRAQS